MAPVLLPVLLLAPFSGVPDNFDYVQKLAEASGDVLFMSGCHSWCGLVFSLPEAQLGSVSYSRA